MYIDELFLQDLFLGRQIIKGPMLTLTVRRSLQQQKQQLRPLRCHVSPDSDEYYGEHSSSQELLMPGFPTSYRDREIQEEQKYNKLKIKRGRSKAKPDCQN